MAQQKRGLLFLIWLDIICNPMLFVLEISGKNGEWEGGDKFKKEVQ